MADLTGVLINMLEFVIVVVIGYIASKLDILDDHVSEKLIGLLMTFTLPAMLVSSVVGLEPGSFGNFIVPALVLGGVEFFLLMGTSGLLARIMRMDPEDRTVYTFMGTALNSGFLGLPIIKAIFGSEAVVLASVFNTTTGLLVFSIGFAMLDRQAQGGEARITIPWKTLLSPATLGSFAAILIFLLQIPLPEVVVGTCSMVGGITSPIAMLVVGQMMSRMEFSSIVGEWRAYPFIVVRQLVVPALLFLALRGFVPSELLVGIFVVMFAMPSGSMSPSYVRNAGLDFELGAKVTILTTASAFIAIPALVMFMTMV